MASHPNNNVRIGSGDGRSGVGVTKGVGAQDWYGDKVKFENATPAQQKMRIETYGPLAGALGATAAVLLGTVAKMGTGGGGVNPASKKTK